VGYVAKREKGYPGKRKKMGFNAPRQNLKTRKSRSFPMLINKTNPDSRPFQRRLSWGKNFATWERVKYLELGGGSAVVKLNSIEQNTADPRKMKNG